MLDVVQGLSIVIEHAGQVMIYDTGLSTPSGFSMADIAIQPFILDKNIKHIDHLIISHNDNDHAGGLQYLLATNRIDRLTLGENVNYQLSHPYSYCKQGESWSWGQVRIDVLHPPLKWQSDSNNQSCVIHIIHPKWRILLAGDIEEDVESLLVDQYDQQLKSNLIIVPHHGSRSSSSQILIDHVQPSYAVISAGINNRYGHPHSVIVMRYLDAGTSVLTTATAGAIRFKFDHTGMHTPESYAEQSRRYWHSVRNRL